MDGGYWHGNVLCEVVTGTSQNASAKLSLIQQTMNALAMPPAFGAGPRLAFLTAITTDHASAETKASQEAQAGLLDGWVLEGDEGHDPAELSLVRLREAAILVAAAAETAPSAQALLADLAGRCLFAE